MAVPQWACWSGRGMHHYEEIVHTEFTFVAFTISPKISTCPTNHWSEHILQYHNSGKEAETSVLNCFIIVIAWWMISFFSHSPTMYCTIQLRLGSSSRSYLSLNLTAPSNSVSFCKSKEGHRVLYLAILKLVIHLDWGCIVHWVQNLARLLFIFGFNSNGLGAVWLNSFNSVSPEKWFYTQI